MVNNHRTSSSKMEDIRQILLQNPELPHEENLHYRYQLEFLNNNLTPSSKIEDIHFQNLKLEPEELHYLCQETNRPTQIEPSGLISVHRLPSSIHLNSLRISLNSPQIDMIAACEGILPAR